MASLPTPYSFYSACQHIWILSPLLTRILQALICSVTSLVSFYNCLRCTHVLIQLSNKPVHNGMLQVALGNERRVQHCRWRSHIYASVFCDASHHPPCAYLSPPWISFVGICKTPNDATYELQNFRTPGRQITHKQLPSVIHFGGTIFRQFKVVSIGASLLNTSFS